MKRTVAAIRAAGAIAAGNFGFYKLNDLESRIDSLEYQFSDLDSDRDRVKSDVSDLEYKVSDLER